MHIFTQYILKWLVFAQWVTNVTTVYIPFTCMLHMKLHKGVCSLSTIAKVHYRLKFQLSKGEAL